VVQIKSTPTDSELAVQIDETESKVCVGIHRPLYCLAQLHAPNALSIYAYDFVLSFRQVARLREHLEPLRAGTPLVSTAELDALDTEWTK
jgi:hypothetical protein